MKAKADYYGVHLSINTADEEESRQALKRLRESNSIQSIAQLQAANLSIIASNNQNSSTMPSTATTMPSTSTTMPTTSTTVPSTSSTMPSTSTTTATEVNLLSAPLITSETTVASFTNAEMQRIFAAYDEKLRTLTEQMNTVRVTNVADPSLEYNGRNLAEVGGKNPAKWALKVVDILFTPEELRRCVLEESNRSKREALDPVRVQLMKKAMVARFDFLQNDQSKIDKAWNVIKDRINNKGRNLVYQFAQLLRNQHNAD
jgi:hypothetical protein